ncbi:MAG: S-layer homology domain-containing protein [Oscillospiraceae bacterium]|nr:S-layer homology domain-containing protein [Oscillospiraceae bacterium]
MNIPYDEFYKAIGTTADSTKFDAISSATNKVGNYGKSGGSFHSVQSAQIREDGSVTAVGGENGAKNEGVTWPVKVSAGTDLSSLGGTEIQSADTRTIATVGRGQTSVSYLYGYECLMEAPKYSFYKLDSAPNNYLELTSINNNIPTLSSSNNNVETKAGAAITASYGSNWGDVQLSVKGVDDVENVLVNAVVITAADGSQATVKAGLVHLYNVWSANDIAWKAATVSGLDGKAIQSITYYCSVKDDTAGEDNSDAPVYQNYIYQYTVSGLSIPSVYTGTVTAKFNSASEIELTGLPGDVQNPTAKVYHTEGRGHDAVTTYLTPLKVDPADQDIDPVNEKIQNGKIAISSTLQTVTNDKGESQTYGQPIDGTEYTIEISSDNWIIAKTTAVYTKSSSNNTWRPSSSRPSSSGGTTSSNTYTKPTNDNTNSSDNTTPSTPSVPSTPSTPSVPSVSFTDVNSSAFYYDAVQWAVAQGITNGTGANTFSPSSPCTRGQVVTFLWRAAGSPASSGISEFTDVQASDYYYDAVRWAVEQGITSGMGSNQFNPNDTCTRSQAVTFLYRYAGSPAVSGTSAFVDVASSAYYANAVNWAVNNHITEGTSASTFGPDDICTRSHIVTFLYRNLAG